MRIVFLFSFVLISFTVSGQTKNYLVTDTGDSLYGEIKLRNGVFLISGKNGENQINADNVRKIYDKKFKGTIVLHCNLNLYSDNLSDLELGYMPIKQKDTVMVLKEIYTTEKMNLYFGTDDLKTQYYFYKTPSDALPVQLVVRYFLSGGLDSYYNNRAGYGGEKSRIHIEIDKGYVNQLKNAMGNCNTISETAWELLDYRDYSFKKLIKQYNNCN
ncbi:hypothetical protein [Ferruginibacter sp.]